MEEFFCTLFFISMLFWSSVDWNHSLSGRANKDSAFFKCVFGAVASERSVTYTGLSLSSRGHVRSKVSVSLASRLSFNKGGYMSYMTEGMSLVVGRVVIKISISANSTSSKYRIRRIRPTKKSRFADDKIEKGKHEVLSKSLWADAKLQARINDKPRYRTRFFLGGGVGMQKSSKYPDPCQRSNITEYP